MANIELTVTSGGGLAVTPAPSLELTVGQPAPALDLTAGPVVSLPEGLATDDAVNAARDALLAALAQMPPPDVSALATSDALAAAREALEGMLVGLYAATGQIQRQVFDDVAALGQSQQQGFSAIAALPSPATPLDLDAAKNELLTALSTAGAARYEIRQFYDPTGATPPGWTRVGGVQPPAVFGSSRVALTARDPLQVSLNQARHCMHQGNLYTFVQASGTWAVYSPSTDAWTYTTAFAPQLKSVAPSWCVSSGGKMYIGLGPPYSGSLFRYDPALDTYTLLSVAGIPQSPLVATLADGRILLAGGFPAGVSSATAANTLTSAAIYNPLTNTTQAIAPLPLRAWNMSISLLLPDDRVFFVAYNTSDGTTAKTFAGLVLIYDPVANAWTRLDDLDTPAMTAGIVHAYAVDGGVVLRTAQALTECARAYSFSSPPGSQRSWLTATLPCVPFTPFVGMQLSTSTQNVVVRLNSGGYSCLGLLRPGGEVVTSGAFYAYKN